jgi:radical SAM protein with 4Fe4S-binding SPASM domain
MDIPTNCLLPEKIESITERILTLCNEANISIDLSIDGVGKTHDFIRGVEGNFDKVNETCRRLRKLKSRHKNLWLKANVTFSYYNQDHIDSILRHINDEMKIKDIYIYPAWGEPKDSKVKDFSFEKYVDAMRAWGKKRELSNKSLFAKAVFAIRKAVAKEALDVIQKHKLNYPCMAIKKVIVINEEGDVYPCPVLKEKLGNLRDYGYDIKKIIYSEKRYDIEKKYKINSDCFCHWDCAIFNSIIYNWRNFPRLLSTVFKNNV